MALVAVFAALPGTVPGLPEAGSVRAGTSDGSPQPATTSAVVIPGAMPSDDLGPLRLAAPLTETLGAAAMLPRDPLHTLTLDPQVRAILDPTVEAAFAARVGQRTGFVLRAGRDAIEAVRTGQANAALVAGDLAPRDLRAGLCQTPLGVQLFALAVRRDFPLASLTRDQVRQVLTGRITDWSRLGCNRGAVVVVAPAQEEIVDRAATALVRGDRITASARRASTEAEAFHQLARNPGAIAVVLAGCAAPGDAKLLQIDWAAPLPELYWSGNYPFGVPLQLITLGTPTGIAAEFRRFCTSEDGREGLARTLLPR